MPLSIVSGDLAHTTADIVVNSAHPAPQIGTGVEKAIYDGAGPELLRERTAYGPLDEGVLFKSPAFQLKATFIYHVITPNYQDADAAIRLAAIYQMCLARALEDAVQSIAFPLLGSGNHIFPKAKALSIATDQIKQFLSLHDMDVILVIYDQKNFQIASPIDDVLDIPIMQAEYASLNAMRSIDEEAPSQESFQAMLFRLIDARGLHDVEVYKNANISRKVFSKIRSNAGYQPAKKTAIALSVSIQLSLDETLDLLATAGYTLSDYLLFDRIVRTFITRADYDIFALNETLFFYDQSTL